LSETRFLRASQTKPPKSRVHYSKASAKTRRNNQGHVSQSEIRHTF
jgi:hypothetical protein